MHNFRLRGAAIDVGETVRARDRTESLDKAAMNRTCEREPALPLIYRGPDETIRLVHQNQEATTSSTTMTCCSTGPI
jgi:hypothetical protein